MQKLITWFQTHNTKIGWFLIGFFICEAFNAIGRGDWLAASFNLLLAALNYSVNLK